MFNGWKIFLLHVSFSNAAKLFYESGFIFHNFHSNTQFRFQHCTQSSKLGSKQSRQQSSKQSVPSQTVTLLTATSELVTSSNSPSHSPDVEPNKPVEPAKYLKNLKPVEPVEIHFQSWSLHT